MNSSESTDSNQGEKVYEKCGNCFYYACTQDGDPICRRYPPTFIKSGLIVNWVYTVTSSKGWCGEWKLRKTDCEVVPFQWQQPRCIHLGTKKSVLLGKKLIRYIKDFLKTE